MLKQAWQKIKLETLENLIFSIPDRVRDVIKNKGHYVIWINRSSWLNLIHKNVRKFVARIVLHPLVKYPYRKRNKIVLFYLYPCLLTQPQAVLLIKLSPWMKVTPLRRLCDLIVCLQRSNKLVPSEKGRHCCALCWDISSICLTWCPTRCFSSSR